MENKRKRTDGMELESRQGEEELLAAFCKELTLNPERMAVLFQMVFAMTDERWEELRELTFLYGSCLKADNVFGRQLFTRLVMFLREKEAQTESYHYN
mgnify:FL=1